MKIQLRPYATDSRLFFGLYAIKQEDADSDITILFRMEGTIFSHEHDLPHDEFFNSSNFYIAGSHLVLNVPTFVQRICRKPFCLQKAVLQSAFSRQKDSKKE